MKVFSTATLAAVAAIAANTMTGGRYDLQRPITRPGMFGDVDEFETVAPGVLLRLTPVTQTPEAAEGVGTGENRAYRVAFPSCLAPAPRSGWRFVSKDGLDILTIEAIEEDPAGGPAVSYAICGRLEAR